MDALYFVRSGPNEELRYSLRALHENLTGLGDVTIVGDWPDWVDPTRINLVPGNPTDNKWVNGYRNLQIGCRELGDRPVVVMNDDLFVMGRCGTPPAGTVGPLSDHYRRVQWDPQWRASLKATHRWLTEQGVPEPVSYEVHVPVVMNLGLLRDVLDAADRPDTRIPCQWRSLYGNMYRVPAAPMVDPKIRSRHAPWDPDSLFLSGDDSVWLRHEAFETVRARFSTPGPWETDTQAVTGTGSGGVTRGR